MKNLYRKTYAIYKFTAYSAIIPFGTKKLRVNFRNGNVNVLRGTEPATYTTDNEAYQKAIEASDNFKRGRIKLYSKVLIGTIDDDETGINTTDNTPTASDNDINEENSKASFPAVKNTQGARAVLMAEPYNIQLSEISTKSAILVKAAQLGIIFPNWK